ncbi:MAG: hypothetical protein A2Y80_02200 [Deltaproteobacteria bacterium RBG_13_58_19]|nr:MAG: hypothetical protein A2Y80_02200 [Deltaproteobacteria bacterium RBG_13_58_19]
MPEPRDLRVISCPHPFRVEREITRMHPGQTVGQLLAEILPDPWRRRQAQVTVNGEIIHLEMWASTIPRPGSLVVVRVFPSSRGIASIFIAIAVIATAFFAGPALASAFGFGSSALWGGLAGMAVGIVGNMIVNALIPPARVSSQGQISQAQDSPTQFISGARNQLIKFGTIPSLLGFHRIVPLKLAEDYTESEGKDQFVRCLFGQHGPVEVSEMQVGNTAWETFEGTESEIRGGWEDDQPLTLFTQDIHEDSTSILLEYNVEQVRTSQTLARELSFDITFPQGLCAYSGNNRVSYTCTFQPRYRLTDAGGGSPGPWINLGIFSVTGASSAAIRKGFRWILPAEEQYDVGLKRLTIADDTTHVSVSYWTAFRTIKYTQPITYPDPLLLIAVRIKGSNQLNGTLDEFNFLGKSVFPDWDSETETWIIRATNNPASLFRALLQGQAAPNPYEDAEIDLNKLAYWHEYCVAKGFIYEKNVDQAGDWWGQLCEVAAAGRARPTDYDGKISVVLDEPQEDPVTIFTARVIRNLEVELLYPDLPHAFRCPFNNRDNDYQKDERLVLADGYQIEGLDAWGQAHPEYPPATKFEQLVLEGVTDPEQIFKLARYHFAQATLRYRKITFDTDLQNLVCTRGDLVDLAHDVIMVGLSSGRVKEVLLEIIGWTEDEPPQPIYSGLISGVALDEICPMQAGQTYFIQFRVPGEELLACQVVTDPGEPKEVIFETFLDAESTNLAAGDLFNFGGSIQVVVTDIKRKGNLEATLTVQDAAPAIHQADQGEIPEFVSTITIPPEWWVPVIDSIRSDGSVLWRAPDGSWVSRILVSLKRLTSRDQDVVGIEGQYWRTGSDETPTFLPLTLIDVGEISLVAVEDGVSYDFRLRYVKGDGSRGPWGATQTHIVEGKTAPPEDVTGFNIYQVKEQVNWAWNRNPDLDIEGYIIAYGAVGVTKAEAIIITEVMLGTSYNSPMVPPGTWDFLIWARDTSGNDSANVTRKSFKVVSFYQTLADVPQFSLWPGTLTNLVRDPMTGHLHPQSQADSGANDLNMFDYYVYDPYAEMSYESPEIDLGEDMAARSWARIYDQLGPGESGSIEPILYFDYKPDGGSYGGWTEWSIGPFMGRYAKDKISMQAADGLRKLTDFEPVIDKSF